MEKKKISKRHYEFLSNQLKKHAQDERITDEQVTKMLDTYELKDGLSFISILLTVGAVLIGLGILSFIASNWIYFGKMTKFLLIILTYLAVNAISYVSQHKYPKTSRSFIYIGVAIFGAGIFLIGQIFNFNGSFTQAFLLWAVGILPLTMITKDKLMMIFLHLLLFVYLNGLFVKDELSIILLLIIPIIYLSLKRFDSSFILFITNILALNFIWYLFNKVAGMDSSMVVILFFIIGLLLYFIKIPYHSNVFKLIGNIQFSIMGFIMTFRNIWNDFDVIKNTDIPVHIIFAVLFFVFLLYLVRQQNLVALIFIGITIFRFYFDTLYSFLPKSIFFFIGGVILLGFGYYFENKRRRIWREK